MVGGLVGPCAWASWAIISSSWRSVNALAHPPQQRTKLESHELRALTISTRCLCPVLLFVFPHQYTLRRIYYHRDL